MYKSLHVLIYFLTIVSFNRIECIKLTRDNVISLGGENGNFYNKQISEIDPAALEVINGTILYLYHNKLTYLQENLFQYNTNFEVLRFDLNKISKIHPLVFQKLQNLSSIELDNNELTEIAEHHFERNTKLRTIDLNSNRITFFHPNSFKNLKKVEYLNVNSNQLTSFDLNSLSSSKGLKYLYLNNNILTEIHYLVLKLRFPKLTKISFTENKFNCSFAKQIQDYLDREHIVEYYGPMSCIGDEEYAAIVRDRQPVSGRQLSVELENMQSKLQDQFSKITLELKNDKAKLENANELLTIDNAKMKAEIAEMKSVMKSLKLQLLEQQAVTENGINDIERVKSENEHMSNEINGLKLQLQSVTERMKIENEDVRNVIKGLKLLLLEQLAVIDELQFATESGCYMTF